MSSIMKTDNEAYKNSEFGLVSDNFRREKGEKNQTRKFAAENIIRSFYR